MKTKIKLGNTTYTITSDDTYDNTTYSIKIGRKEILRTIQYYGGMVQYSKRIGNSWFGGNIFKDMQTVIMDLINEHYENELYVNNLINVK